MSSRRCWTRSFLLLCSSHVAITHCLTAAAPASEGVLTFARYVGANSSKLRQSQAISWQAEASKPIMRRDALLEQHDPRYLGNEAEEGNPYTTTTTLTTTTEAPNDQASFLVSGAGQAAFNGIYTRSEVPGNGGCDTLVWGMTNAAAYHMLYSQQVDGKLVWRLQERGENTMYEGSESNTTCDPEDATWASVRSDAGAAPSVVRLLAADAIDRLGR
mmetsp:Transcript_62799/g.97791  ORF Transcript_62799/g.97791 Transcript_62799/m.97791 type:complete len:216 (+) Transcript_62799:25-672(+)